MDRAASSEDTRRITAWLARSTAASRSPASRAASILLVLDGLGAIAFAGGLAGAVAARGAARAGPAPALRDMAPWLALALAATACRAACAFGAAEAGAVASARARRASRRDLVATALRLPPGLRPPTGETMAVAIDAVEALDAYVAQFLPARRAASVAPLLILAATAIASPIAAAIISATAIPFVLFMALAGHASAEAARAQFTSLRRLSGLFADRVRALPTILAFRAVPRVAEALAVSAEELRARSLRVLRIAFLSSAALEFFAALSIALVAAYAGFRLLGWLPFLPASGFGFGTALFALALAPEFYAPMRRLAGAYHARQIAESAAAQILAFQALDTRRPPRAARAAPLGLPPRISFADVTIAHPGAGRPALAGFHLEVAPGEIVALLGPSGAGKTTALSALLGLVAPQSGEIRVGGRALLPLRDPDALLPSIAWSGAAPMIVPGSLADNIRLGRRGATRAAIEEAARQVGLGPLLAARGLDAALDERGSGLSGGERSRIGLARALLKAAPILLLDEPTAHLDAASETAMIDAIRIAACGRTTLIATHSEALAARADRIVRLEAA